MHKYFLTLTQLENPAFLCRAMHVTKVASQVTAIPKNLSVIISQGYDVIFGYVAVLMACSNARAQYFFIVADKPDAAIIITA